MAFKDPERERAYKREWYLRNREKIRERARETNARYYQDNREKIREHYQDNRAAISEQRRAQRLSDPERRERDNARSRDWYERNRAAALKRQRGWQQRNREKQRTYKRGYYLRNREYHLAAMTFNTHGLRPEDWSAMWEAQGGLCYLCGEPMIPNGKTGAHVDHDHSHCPPNRSCRVCQRGLACMDCNIALGHTRDDAARLRRMADALEAAQLLVDQRKAEAGERLTLF